MNKETLNAAVEVCKVEAKNAIETILAELNNGQRKKLIRNEIVKPILDRFGVEYEE